MHDAPPKAPANSWLKHDQVRFALILAAASAVLVSLILTHRSRGPDVAHPLRVVQQRLKARHLVRAQQKLERACGTESCECAVATAGAGLDVDLGREVLQVLDAARTCSNQELKGMRAEALARVGKAQEAMQAANEVLVPKRTDPYALLAQAWVANLVGQRADAITIAHEALAAGRGSPASFLLGVVHLSTNALDDARRDFRAVLDAEPENVDAFFYLGLVGAQDNRYNDARSAFLRVLKLDPTRKEARYQLGWMAHKIGADAEARHHLAKLSAMAPGDPLVKELTTALATPAQPPGQVLTLGSASP